MQRKNGEDEAMMAPNEHHEVNNYPAVPVLLDSEESRIWEPESLVFDKEFCKGNSIVSASNLSGKEKPLVNLRKGFTTEKERLTKMGKLFCSFGKLLPKKKKPFLKPLLIIITILYIVVYVKPNLQFTPPSPSPPRPHVCISIPALELSSKTEDNND